jgi:polysaccharide chain length determinant protein (PEP-CTERM system associated)
MPTTPPTLHDDASRGPGLTSILEVLRRRRRLAVLPFLFVLAAAVSMAMFLPSLWTARATVLVNRQEIPEALVRSTVNSDVEARLLTLTFQTLDAPRLTTIIQDNNLYPALRRTKPMSEVVERMRRDIKVDVPEDRDRRNDRESRSVIFTLGYAATDPAVAVRVTNTLASLFSEENRRMRQQQAAGATEFFDTQLRELRERLNAQEQKITAYKELHLGELPEQREVNIRTLERLQQQLSIARETNRRAVDRRQNITQSLNELDVASAMGPAGAGPGGGPGETAAMRLATLRNELAALQTTYSDKYPDVIQTKEQIRQLEKRVAEDDKKLAAAGAKSSGSAAAGSKQARDLRLAGQNPYVLSLMQQLDQANIEAKATGDEIGQLNRQASIYERRLEQMPKREQELALITRDYEATREQFRSLLAKRGEANVASDLEQRQKGESFRLIEPASTPERPTGPNRIRLILVGLALAIAAGGVSVLVAEQIDTSYRRADEVRATAGVPVLSTIPRIVTEADRLSTRRHGRLVAAAVLGGLLLVVGTSFLVAHDNQSLVSVLTADPAAAKR